MAGRGSGIGRLDCAPPPIGLPASFSQSIQMTDASGGQGDGSTAGERALVGLDTPRAAASGSMTAMLSDVHH